MPQILILSLTSLFLLSTLGCTLIGAKPTVHRMPQNLIQSQAVDAPFEISTECKGFISRLQNDSRFEYGWIQTDVRAGAVELKASSPEREQNPVYVFYYYRRDPAGLIPTLLLNGGPAESSWSYYTEFEKRTDRDRFSLVYMDQRGTGCSSSVPQYLSKDDYFYWATRGYVTDAEQIRKKLGIKKWNIFGHSMGAIYAYRYMQEAPESLLTVIAMGGTMLEHFSQMSTLRKLGQVRVVQAFLASYPGAQARVDKIVGDARCAPLGGALLCGSALVSGLAEGSMAFHSKWEDFDRELFEASQSPDHVDPLDPINDKSKPSKVDVWLSTMIWKDVGGGGSSIDYSFRNCTALNQLKDRSLLALLESPPSVRTKIAAPPCARNPTVEFKAIQYDRHLSKVGHPTVSFDKLRANFHKYPALQFYLFSAEFDYYSPPEQLAEAAKQLGPVVHYQELRE